MKSKGRSPDIKPWPSHPGTFFFSPTGPTNSSVGAAVALAQRAAYRRLIGHLSSEHRSLKPENTHRGPLEGEKSASRPSAAGAKHLAALVQDVWR